MSSMSGEIRRTHQVLVGPILLDGAKWLINNHAEDPPFFWDGCSPAMFPGILIFMGPKAPTPVRAAATVLSKALRGIMSTSIAKTMPVVAVESSFFAPLGKSHPYNLLVGHPELIVVVVGEHPKQ
jgi:hypothetical protein